MNERLIENSRRLFGELASTLLSNAQDRPEARQFADALHREMSQAILSEHAAQTRDISPVAELMLLFDRLGDQPVSPILDAVQQIEPLCGWFRADRFYPEPQHRAFAENVWGALLAGQDDALVGTQDRYIALLIVIGPNTTYPLHAHRIEELYFVLSGAGDWSHDGGNWIPLHSGSTFYNHSYQPHAIRTADQPVMAIGLYLPPFGWEGGLL